MFYSYQHKRSDNEELNAIQKCVDFKQTNLEGLINFQNKILDFFDCY